MSLRCWNKRVWVAGHRGMVGAALVRRLAREDCDRPDRRPRETCDLASGARRRGVDAQATAARGFPRRGAGRRNSCQRRRGRRISSTTT